MIPRVSDVAGFSEQTLQLGSESRIARTIAASQAVRVSRVIASASSKYGLSARQRSAVSGAGLIRMSPAFVIE